MKVMIHQPEHFPQLSYLDRIKQSDLFVVLDTCDFRKNYYQNRNKISENKWITVPVPKHNHIPIKDIIISNIDWKNSYLNNIRNQFKTDDPYFELIYNQIKLIIEEQLEYSNSLLDLNMKILEWLYFMFDLNTPIIKASQLNINISNYERDEYLLKICKEVKATEWIVGESTYDYLNKELFFKNNIKITKHNYFSPPYINNKLTLDCLFKFKYNCNLLLDNKGKFTLQQILKDIHYEKSWSSLEVFGGNGSGHLTEYAFYNKKAEIWELYPENADILKCKFRNSLIKQTDSLKEIKKCDKVYNLVILDTPATMKNKDLIKDAYRLVQPNGYLIFRVIDFSYNDNEELTNILKEDYFPLDTWKIDDIKCLYERNLPYNIKIYPREYCNDKLWLYNFVVKKEF